jgi:GntR family transcriptional regulator
VGIQLDRSSAQPLWAQLEADLRSRLDAREFDQRFPTDLELTRHYGVSRHTVREAISHLNRDGLLKRERGRGTVVDRSEFVQQLGALYSLFRSIEDTGVEQRSEVLDVGIVVDPEVAARLDVDADTELFRLDRLRLADDAPLAIDRAWLPADLARPLLEADFSHTALYDELERRCGTRPDRGWERITPVIPDEDERELLALDPATAAFSVERLGHDGDRAVEWRVTIIRGDRYRFFADFSPSTSGGLTLGPHE